MKSETPNHDKPCVYNPYGEVETDEVAEPSLSWDHAEEFPIASLSISADSFRFRVGLGDPDNVEAFGRWLLLEAEKAREREGWE